MKGLVTTDQTSLEKALTEAFGATPDPQALSRARARCLTAFGRSFRSRTWQSLVSAVLIVILGAWAVSAYALTALPGDLTYPIKLLLQDSATVLEREPVEQTNAWLEISEVRFADVLRAELGGSADALEQAAISYAAAAERARARTEAAGDQALSARTERLFSTHHQVLAELIQANTAGAKGLQRALEASKTPSAVPKQGPAGKVEGSSDSAGDSAPDPSDLGPPASIPGPPASAGEKAGMGTEQPPPAQGPPDDVGRQARPDPPEGGPPMDAPAGDRP